MDAFIAAPAHTPAPPPAPLSAQPLHQSLAFPPMLPATQPVSPLVLADRLITLAQDADRAGYRDAASDLVSLVYTVLDRATPN